MGGIRKLIQKTILQKQKYQPFAHQNFKIYSLRYNGFPERHGLGIYIAILRLTFVWSQFLLDSDIL